MLANGLIHVHDHKAVTKPPFYISANKFSFFLSTSVGIQLFLIIHLTSNDLLGMSFFIFCLVVFIALGIYLSIIFLNAPHFH